MTFHTASSTEPSGSCDPDVHQYGCPCRVGGDPIYREVRVVNHESTFLGLRGEVRQSYESGTVLVRFPGWDIDLPFGWSEVEEENRDAR